jgi:hypothetical protein
VRRVLLRLEAALEAFYRLGTHESRQEALRALDALSEALAD